MVDQFTVLFEPRWRLLTLSRRTVASDVLEHVGGKL